MKILLMLIYLVIAYLSINTIFAQELSTKEFWSNVQLNYSSQQMSDGIRSWLFQVANKDNSYSEALAKMENMTKNTDFQNSIFFSAYIASGENKENLRMILGNLCGSFSVGNPVSDYVFYKYNNDQEAIKFIKNQKKIAEMQLQIEERKEEISDSIEKQEEQNRNDFSMKREKFDSLNNFVKDCRFLINTGMGEKWSIDDFFSEQPPHMKDIDYSDWWEFYLSKQGLTQPHLSDDYEPSDSPVIASFTVTQDGNVKDVKIEFSQNEKYDSQSLKIINNTSGMWIPAKKRIIVEKKYKLLTISQSKIINYDYRIFLLIYFKINN